MRKGGREEECQLSSANIFLSSGPFLTHCSLTHLSSSFFSGLLCTAAKVIFGWPSKKTLLQREGTKGEALEEKQDPGIVSRETRGITDLNKDRAKYRYNEIN